MNSSRPLPVVLALLLCLALAPARFAAGEDKTSAHAFGLQVDSELGQNLLFDEGTRFKRPGDPMAVPRRAAPPATVQGKPVDSPAAVEKASRTRAAVTVPMRVRVGFRLATPGLGTPASPAPADRTDAAKVAALLTAMGYKVAAVELKAGESAGVATLQSDPSARRRLGGIEIKYLPGPAVEGSAEVVASDLLVLLGGNVPLAGTADDIVLFDDAFEASASVYEKDPKLLPSEVAPARKQRLLYWAQADSVLADETLQPPSIGDLVDPAPVDLELGPIKMSAEEDGVSIEPAIELAGAKISLGRKIHLQGFAPPRLKTPAGGVLLQAGYSIQGLEKKRASLTPAADDAHYDLVSGIGLGKGRKRLDTSQTYAELGDRAPSVMSLTRSPFCKAQMPAALWSNDKPQDVLCGDEIAPTGPYTLDRLTYLKLDVSLSLSKNQIDSYVADAIALRFRVWPEAR